VRGKPIAYEIALEQQFQVVSGSARVSGRAAKIQNAKLEGDRLVFDLVAEIDGERLKHEFSGKVEGATIDGIAELSGAKLQGRQEWSATRAAASAASTIRSASAGNAGPGE
jgi:hypothetical protein